MHRVIETVEPSLYGKFVKTVNMAEQRDKGQAFRNYPYALYATDVKFQQAYRPSGRYIEQKAYFSAKHKLYGFKIEFSVAHPGVAVDISDHCVGSKSDLTMMLDRLKVHKAMVRKDPDDESTDAWSQHDPVSQHEEATSRWHSLP